MSAPEYRPDDDAVPLDRAVMDVAARLHAAGWTEEAEEVAAAMATLREAFRDHAVEGPHGELPALIDLLDDVCGASAYISKATTSAFPDEIALRVR